MCGRQGANTESSLFPGESCTSSGCAAAEEVRCTKGKASASSAACPELVHMADGGRRWGYFLVRRWQAAQPLLSLLSPCMASVYCSTTGAAGAEACGREAGRALFLQDRGKHSLPRTAVGITAHPWEGGAAEHPGARQGRGQPGRTAPRVGQVSALWLFEAMTPD